MASIRRLQTLRYMPKGNTSQELLFTVYDITPPPPKKKKQQQKKQKKTTNKQINEDNKNQQKNNNRNNYHRILKNLCIYQ